MTDDRASGSDLPEDYGTFPLRTFLDFDVVDAEPGVSVATMDVSEATANPNGVVHGGALFTLVDTAMGGAAMSVLEPGRFCASIDVHMRFLKPVHEGSLEATARVVRHGRRILHLDADVVANGDLVATATAAFAVLEFG